MTDFPRRIGVHIPSAKTFVLRFRCSGPRNSIDNNAYNYTIVHRSIKLLRRIAILLLSSSAKTDSADERPLVQPLLVSQWSLFITLANTF